MRTEATAPNETTGLADFHFGNVNHADKEETDGEGMRRNTS